MNTILFDLDGTLLPLDLDVFEAEYFKLLTQRLKDILPPDKAIKYIWESTIEMVLNTDSDRTNKEIFMEKFQKLSGLDPNLMYEVFLDFYDKEYKSLSKLFMPSDSIITSIELLKDKGYTLVIATNPLFPRQAISERVKWAGLNISDFILITDFENMHFCKPQIKYYQEILNHISKDSEDCLMVGNDVEEDLIARKIGIKTFLIEDNILNKKNIVPETDYRGSYPDFLEFVKSLPKVDKSIDSAI